MQNQSKYQVCSFKNRSEKKKNIKKCMNCPALPLPFQILNMNYDHITQYSLVNYMLVSKNTHLPQGGVKLLF